MPPRLVKCVHKRLCGFRAGGMVRGLALQHIGEGHNQAEHNGQDQKRVDIAERGDGVLVERRDQDLPAGAHGADNAEKGGSTVFRHVPGDDGQHHRPGGPRSGNAEDDAGADVQAPDRIRIGQ